MIFKFHGYKINSLGGAICRGCFVLGLLGVMDKKEAKNFYNHDYY
jgi:hypothetical protein